jgi:uncharacterized membrane-anchored protein
MENGEFGSAATSGPSVALVLADRKAALDRAWDLAQGITPELRVKWAQDSEQFAKQAEAERAQRAETIAACKKCQKAKSGRCNEHRVRYGRSSYRSYERTGTQYNAGYADGQSADLGTGVAVSNGSTRGIEE